jgi:lysozyme
MTAGARRAGITVGAYHFFTLCGSGAAQARNFLRAAPPAAEALAPAVDLELPGNCAARPDRAAVLAELGGFVRAVEARWHRPVVLHVGASFESRYHVAAEARRPLWERRLVLRPRSASWLVWQVHGNARVRGVRGPVDLDVPRPATSAAG